MGRRFGVLGALIVIPILAGCGATPSGLSAAIEDGQAGATPWELGNWDCTGVVGTATAVVTTDSVDIAIEGMTNPVTFTYTVDQGTFIASNGWTMDASYAALAPGDSLDVQLMADGEPTPLSLAIERTGDDTATVRYDDDRIDLGVDLDCARTVDGFPSPEAGDANPESPFSASAECDAYVAAKDEGIAEGNQRAVQVAVSDLPFTLPDTAPVLCVDAIYTRDAPETRPLGFEMVVDATNGVGLNMFYGAADLTTFDCPTASPMACFKDSSSNLVVVEDAMWLADYFGDGSFIGAGIHTSAEYRNG